MPPVQPRRARPKIPENGRPPYESRHRSGRRHDRRSGNLRRRARQGARRRISRRPIHCPHGSAGIVRERLRDAAGRASLRMGAAAVGSPSRACDARLRQFRSVSRNQRRASTPRQVAGRRHDSRPCELCAAADVPACAASSPAMGNAVGRLARTADPRSVAKHVVGHRAFFPGALLEDRHHAGSAGE